MRTSGTPWTRDMRRSLLNWAHTAGGTVVIGGGRGERKTYVSSPLAVQVRARRGVEPHGAIRARPT